MTSFRTAPAVLVPRRWRYEITERIDAQGNFKPADAPQCLQWALACTPLPSSARTWVCDEARWFVTAAEAAAVRISVISLPSMTASGSSVSGVEQKDYRELSGNARNCVAR